MWPFEASYKVTDALGNDVTHNYKFEIENDLGAVNIDENSDNDESINPIGTINVNLDLGECNIEFTEE